MDLIELPYETPPKEEVSLKPNAKPRKVHHEVDHPQLSENIQKFDRKIKRKPYNSNPYSYNSVVQRRVNVPPVQNAENMITNSTYNTIGKFLGVDTTHEWNKSYDKVYTIVEWAKAKTGTTSLYRMMQWISHKSKTIPSVGNKRIDDLYLFARMYFQK